MSTYGEEMAVRNAWLKSLSEGDPVVVAAGFGGESQRLGVVARVTATQIAVGTTRYARKDGRMIGSASGYNRPKLVEPTPARLAEIRRGVLARHLAGTDWRALPLETLEAVAAALDAHETRTLNEGEE